MPKGKHNSPKPKRVIPKAAEALYEKQKVQIDFKKLADALIDLKNKIEASKQNGESSRAS